MADLRVIYLVHPSKGVPAPELMVRFRCRVCGGETVLDAFMGVPVCGGDKVALEGISVIRTEPPYEDHSSGTVINDIGGTARDKGALDRSSTDALDARFGETTP